MFVPLSVVLSAFIGVYLRRVDSAGGF